MRVLLACALIIAIPRAIHAEGTGVIAVSRSDRAATARAMAQAIAAGDLDPGAAADSLARP